MCGLALGLPVPSYGQEPHGKIGVAYDRHRNPHGECEGAQKPAP